MGPIKAQIIVMLVQEAGEVVTYDRFCAGLWPEERRRDRAQACLRSHVHQLRETVGPAMILTAPGIGYVWSGLDAEKPE
jgi:DNA-binding response OmpR family regulator